MINAYCQICHQYEGALYPLPPKSVRQGRTMRCPSCSREVFLVDIPSACAHLGINRRTLYRYREAAQITTVSRPGGRTLIYWSSLFER